MESYLSAPMPSKNKKKMNLLVLLQLSDNKISSLESVLFNGLKSLKELRLNGNRIQSLPEVIFEHLSELRLVDLS